MNPILPSQDISNERKGRLFDIVRKKNNDYDITLKNNGAVLIIEVFHQSTEGEYISIIKSSEFIRKITDNLYDFPDELYEALKTAL